MSNERVIYVNGLLDLESIVGVNTLSRIYEKAWEEFCAERGWTNV